MTLSSLFDSLDRLDETDDEEEDFSGVYLSLEPANNNIPHCSFNSRKRSRMRSSVDENAESKRAKIFVLEHASSTLQPRHGGTGAPLDETTGQIPVNNTTVTELYPSAVHFSSPTCVNTVAKVGPERDNSIQTAKSSLASSCSNSSLASAPIESENNQSSMSLGADDVTETGMCLPCSSQVSSREEFEPEGGEQSASVSGGLSIRGSAIQAEAPSDPLGSLVALVREMTHGEFNSERSSSPEIPEPKVLSRQKDPTNTTHSRQYPRPHGNGFACMTGNTVPAAPCVNQALVDELSRLRDIYEAKKHEDPSNQFRVLNYTKGAFASGMKKALSVPLTVCAWVLPAAIRSIAKHSTKITSVDQVSHLPGVGAGITEKISEFIATGCVAKIAAQTTEDLAVARLFQGIYGVGPQTAHSWYVRGLRTLADVRNRVGGIVLSPAQELGLQYYTDLQRRMPRSEAAEIFERIKVVALQLDPMLDIEIMGSFRRQKLLSHDLAVPDDENELEAKYMGLCQLHSDTLMRRIDILTIPCEQWGSALLYFTGDDLFNRSMRLLARKNGMSLNQRGLFQGVIRDPKTQRKTNNGVLIASRTEREIFDRLRVPWREPHERSVGA
ncbi:DNA polymerase IV [Rhizoctonia solani]|uniref:DNA polymerase n=1 Tax=Rhizoctonia solani TaxID=456999 RepID=A0A0K6FZK1_9AGAM|nr:DNA polymerase IV [Rhizoctonia solani]